MRIRNVFLWALFFLLIIGLFKYLSQNKDNKTSITTTNHPLDTTLFTPKEDKQTTPPTTDTVVPIEMRGDSSQQLM